MIYAQLSDGDWLLGIDAENVRRMKAGRPLRIELKRFGGTNNVIIMYGETLSEIHAELVRVFGKLPTCEPDPTVN